MTTPIQLTPHFTLAEFHKSGPVPDSFIPIYTELAERILEPVRTEFAKPLEITSGYRTQKENTGAHGQPNSEHMATTFMCACDFYIEGIGMRFVFDWMRNNPFLPYHQLILESDASGISVIHVSINKMMPGVRSVLVGATHNLEKYAAADHVAYVPEDQRDIDANKRAV